MLNPPKLEHPSTSSVILKLSSVTGPRQSMAGFADLVNLKDESCPVTRGRRIQVSQMGATGGPSGNCNAPKGFTEESGNMIRKRWSFHSANQITEILKEDQNLKPILSPKRRKSSGTGLMRSHSEVTGFANFAVIDEVGPAGKLSKISGHAPQSSTSSKFAHTSRQQSQSHHHHSRHSQTLRHRIHHRRSNSGKSNPQSIGADAEAGGSKKQRQLDEYFMRTNDEPVPSSFHQFRVRRNKYVREPEPDYITAMPDEILLRIFKLLPKPTLANVGRTSHRFLGLIEDESLWKRLCLMGRLLEPEHLYVIMQRRPVYLRMARAHIPDPIEFPRDIMQQLTSSSQLTYLDLSCAIISPGTLALIMKISPNVVKLSLEHLNVTKEVLNSMMGMVSTLDTLNLTMCYDLDPGILAQFFSHCRKLKELNMGCISAPHWTRDDLTTVTRSLPSTLIRLNIAGFRNLFDNDHVAIIVTRCQKLWELDLSDSADLHAKSIEYVLQLKHLQHLSLSRCYGIEPSAYTCLAGHKTLKSLDLYSLFKETSIRQLGTTLQGIEINKYPYSGIARPTVGNKRSSIWLQRVRD